ncbi:hypothetical protein JXA84_04150 [candidate division WOR-3 bacterium]|nr:hypothetical protein [candidate division WOR-3 bacterium]
MINSIGCAVIIFFLSSLFGENDRESVRFTGKVFKGEEFIEPISATLIFKLLPKSDDGWFLWIGGEDSLKNYCSAATPPFRGINATIIEGWHFRNADNSGSNDGKVNAPQNERGFRFVLDDSCYTIAEKYVKMVCWPHEYTQDEIDAASYEFNGLKFGRGRLIITDMKLGNLFVGERAILEYIEFEVELENFR